MKDQEKTRTVEYFSKRIELHGNDVRTVDWGSKESQQLRFRTLLDPFELKEASILDVGSGLGDLYGYLLEEGGCARYLGIDITGGMVELAQQHYTTGEFCLLDVLQTDKIRPGDFDYIVANGIFYLLEDAPYIYMENMIKKLFSLAGKAIAFTSLSCWADRQNHTEFYADPCRVLEICKKFSNQIILSHDYHPNDFCIHMFKGIRS